jgi:lipopolysaccharide export system permease protein
MPAGTAETAHMWSIVDRYFLTEILKIFGAIITTLLLVVASMLFLRTLEQVNVGTLQANMVLRFLGLQLLRDTASLLAPAAFLAVLMALGRMARDSELVALTAGGIGPLRFFRAVLMFTVPMTLVAAAFALFLQPYASAQIQLIEAREDDEATRISGLQAGRFYQQEGGRVTFYATALDDDNRFSGVFVQDRRGDTPRVVLSKRGWYRDAGDTGERAVVLEDGQRYDGVAGELGYQLLWFERLTYAIAGATAMDAQRWRHAARPTVALLASDEIRDRVELQHRLAAVLGVIALGILAVPLTQLSPRQRSGSRLAIAFLAYFAFFNGQRLAEEWMATGATPAWLGTLWYQVLIVALVFVALLPGSYALRRVHARLRGR